MKTSYKTSKVNGAPSGISPPCPRSRPRTCRRRWAPGGQPQRRWQCVTL